MQPVCWDLATQSLRSPIVVLRSSWPKLGQDPGTPFPAAHSPPRSQDSQPVPISSVSGQRASRAGRLSRALPAGAVAAGQPGQAPRSEGAERGSRRACAAPVPPPSPPADPHAVSRRLFSHRLLPSRGDGCPQTPLGLCQAPALSLSRGPFPALLSVCHGQTWLLPTCLGTQGTQPQPSGLTPQRSFQGN